MDIKEKIMEVVCKIGNEPQKFIWMMIGLGIGIVIINIWIYLKIGKEYQDLQKKGGELPEELKVKLLNQESHMNINAQTLIEDYIGSWKIVSFLKAIKASPSIMIIIGVLGTFIGLINALQGLDIEQTKQIALMLNGMYTAFITSIVGIVLSIILQLIFNVLNCESRLTNYMLKLEISVNAQIEDKKGIQTLEKLEEVSRNVIKISEGLEALTELGVVAKELNQFNVDFRKNINVLTGTLEKSSGLMNTFAVNVVKLSEKFNGLIEQFENHNKGNQAIIQHVKESRESVQESVRYQKILNEEIQNLFIEQKEFTKTMGDTITDTLSKVNNHQEEIVNKNEEVFSKINRSLEVYQKQFLQVSEEHIVNIKKEFREINSQSRAVIEEVKIDINEAIDNIVEEQQNAAKNIGSSMLVALEKLTTTQEEILSQTHTVFNKVDSTLEMQQKQIVQISEDNISKAAKQMEIIESQSKQIKSIFNENIDRLQENINKVLNKGADQYDLVNRYIEENNYVIKHLMERYVSVEGSQEKLIDQVKNIVEELQEHTQKIENNLGENMNKSLDRFQQHLEFTRKLMAENLKVLNTQHLAQKFIEAHNKIKE